MNTSTSYLPSMDESDVVYARLAACLMCVLLFMFGKYRPVEWGFSNSTCVIYRT